MLYWEGWTYSIESAWIEIILHGIICVLMTIVLITFCWIFFCDKEIPFLNHVKTRDLSLSPTTSGSSGNRSITASNSVRNIKRKSHEYYLKAILFGSIMCGVSNVYSNFWISNVLILVFNYKPSHGCFHRGLCIISLYFQRLLTFIFFLYRLKLAFNGSTFALSAFLWYGLLIAMFVLLFGSLFFIVVATYINGTFRCLNPLVNIAFGVGGICDVGYSIFICYIFVSKLKKLLQIVESDFANSQIKKVMKKLTILSYVFTYTHIRTIYIYYLIRYDNWIYSISDSNIIHDFINCNSNWMVFVSDPSIGYCNK